MLSSANLSRRLATVQERLALIAPNHAIDNDDRAPRKLHRITVAGGIPVGVDGQHSYGIEGDSSRYSPVVDLV